MSHTHHHTHQHDGSREQARSSLSLLRLSVSARLLGVSAILIVLWVAVIGVMQ